MSSVAVKAVTNPWQRFDAIARSAEIRYRAAALALLFRERNDVSERIASAPPSVKADSPQDPHPSVADPYIEAAVLLIAADYAPGGKYHEAWLARYQRLIATTMAVGSRSIPGRVGLSFSLRNQRAIDAVARRVNRLTGNVSQTITIPANAVPDSYKLLVKIYPGVFSQVLEGTEGMLRLPGG